jgi:hypothetical protein
VGSSFQEGNSNKDDSSREEESSGEDSGSGSSSSSSSNFMLQATCYSRLEQREIFVCHAIHDISPGDQAVWNYNAHSNDAGAFNAKFA